LAPEIIRLHEDGWRQFGQSEATPGDVLLDVWQTSLALVATATLAELKKIRSWVTSADACQMMIARQPDWLAEGLELMLDRTSSSFAIGEVAHAINRWKRGWRDFKLVFSELHPSREAAIDFRSPGPADHRRTGRPLFG